MPWFIKTKSEREARKKLADDIWVKCQSCNAHVFKQDFLNNMSVCPKCNWHGKLTAYERIGITFDSGTFKEFNETICPSDPLSFVDGKGPYTEKVDQAKKKTGLNEAVITGTGKICGTSAVIAVMDFRFLGGALALQQGRRSLRQITPVSIASHTSLSASGGARMHEGILSLMQMAKTCAGIARMNERSCPTYP